jgi:hypothetical protein
MGNQGFEDEQIDLIETLVKTFEMASDFVTNQFRLLYLKFVDEESLKKILEDENPSHIHIRDLCDILNQFGNIDTTSFGNVQKIFELLKPLGEDKHLIESLLDATQASKLIFELLKGT